MSRLRPWLALLALAGSALAQPADQTVQKLTLIVGKKPIEVWLTRADSPDGSLVLKLIDKGVGPRPQAIHLYRGGGGDDGPGTGDFRSLTGTVVDLPMAGKAVRVDFTFQIPGSKEEQTDSTLVSFDGKTHKLLTVTTRRTRQRGPLCRMIEETALHPEGDELDGRIVAIRQQKAHAELDEEDEPRDKSCVNGKEERRTFRFNGTRYLQASEVAPSPRPSPSPAPVEED